MLQPYSFSTRSEKVWKRSPARKPWQNKVRLNVEVLEDRSLLSANSLVQSALNPNGTLTLVALNANDLGFGQEVDVKTQLTPSGAWTGWMSLGEPTVVGGGNYAMDQVALAQNQNNTLEVFVHWNGGAVFQKAEASLPTQANPNGVWGGWGIVGTYHLFGLTQITVARNGANAPHPGTLQVLAINQFDRKLYSSAQQSASGPWGAWGTVGEAPVSLQQIVVAQNSGTAPNPYTLEVFGLGSNNQVYHITQQTAGGAWGPFTSLGGPSGVTIVQITTVQNPNGTLQVFALGSNRNIYSISQLSPGGLWGTWGAIGTIPGGIDGTDIEAGLDVNGRVEVFVLGTNKHVYVSTRGDNSQWSSFTSIGAPSDGIMDITVGRNQNGTLEVFAIKGTTDHDPIWSEAQGLDGIWSGLWGSLGELGTTTTAPTPPP